MGVQISSSRDGNAKLIQDQNKPQSSDQAVARSKSPKVQENIVIKLIRMMGLGKNVDIEV